MITRSVTVYQDRKTRVIGVSVFTGGETRQYGNCRPTAVKYYHKCYSEIEQDTTADWWMTMLGIKINPPDEMKQMRRIMVAS